MKCPPHPFLRSSLPGQITFPNLVKTFGAEEHARKIMDEVNLSGNGLIIYGEFKTMMMEYALMGETR